MAKSLQEYADWLDEQHNLWPAPPEPVSTNATAFVKPLKGIRGVAWNVYGTLLRITSGRLRFKHPELSQMQVALEKIIAEFNMWHSMPRKPGPPWEQLNDQYLRILEEQRMSDTQRKGERPEVDSSRIWRKLLRRLAEKGYDYDMNLYGDPEELSDKVAYFFHSCLQGVEAAPNALNALAFVSDSKLTQGLLAEAQSFTIVQMLRALRAQGTLPPLGTLFALDTLTLSFQEGVAKPSPSLYRNCLEKFRSHGIGPSEVLYIGNRLSDDLAIAKGVGMRTALYAADKTSLRATKEEMKNPEMRPDRLLTDLAQIRDILAIG